ARGRGRRLVSAAPERKQAAGAPAGAGRRRIRMSFWVDSLSTGVVLGVPLAYAAVGELIAERAGVVNLGVEGMMLIGAVVGFIVALKTGSVPLAFVIAALAGGILAMVFGAMTINLRTNQIVMGLTLT